MYLFIYIDIYIYIITYVFVGAWGFLETFHLQNLYASTGFEYMIV